VSTLGGWGSQPKASVLSDMRELVWLVLAQLVLMPLVQVSSQSWTPNFEHLGAWTGDNLEASPLYYKVSDCIRCVMSMQCTALTAGAGAPEHLLQACCMSTFEHVACIATKPRTFLHALAITKVRSALRDSACRSATRISAYTSFLHGMYCLRLSTFSCMFQSSPGSVVLMQQHQCHCGRIVTSPRHALAGPASLDDVADGRVSTWRVTFFFLRV
jgi:hypothetical protein